MPLKKPTRMMKKRGSRRASRKIVSIPPRISNNVHHFKRTVELSAITASSLGNTYGAIAFTLGSLPNVSEFTGLYDFFRINKIKVKFVPAVSGLDGNPNSTLYGMPNFHSCVDYDDSTAPTAITNLMEYPNYKCSRGHQTHTRYFSPAIATEIYRSAVTTSYSPKWKSWVDLIHTDVPHYGVKYAADVGAASGAQWLWRVYATFYFSCKGTR